jgi:hypothetical protein
MGPDSGRRLRRRPAVVEGDEARPEEAQIFYFFRLTGAGFINKTNPISLVI